MGRNFFWKNVQKWPFGSKKMFRSFFETVPFGPLITDKISENFFSSGKGPIGHFSKNKISISVAKMGIKRLRFDHWWFWKKINDPKIFALEVNKDYNWRDSNVIPRFCKTSEFSVTFKFIFMRVENESIGSNLGPLACM